ncbi:MAG: hypothetical protein KF729_23435 [Sandaracinaceae bacterium]|nr:hypothetical protein [Sandaracinaceae bacterium]
MCALALAAGCGESDLRARIDAAGVYSPGRNDSVPRARIELGRLLFFDPELSGNRDVACSSCHLPVDHAGDGQPLGRGVGGRNAGSERQGGVELPRHSIAPFNRSYAQSLLWDGRVERLADGSIRAPVPLPSGIATLLEAQALLPLIDRQEMRGEAGDVDVRGEPNELASISDDDPRAVWDAVMRRLMAIEGYRNAFATAFPDVPIGEHGIVHVVRAIALFEMRLWELTDTAFDGFLGSEHRPPSDDALHPLARRGAELFFGDAGCVRCHDGPLLSDDAFHNIGVPPFGPGKAGGIDEGRFLVTGDPRDRFAFRTPPLRNVALTPPYMHDGVFGTLREAVQHHLDPEATLARRELLVGGVRVPIDPAVAADIRTTLSEDVRPLRSLAPDEVEALSSFLESLSSNTEQFGLPPAAGEPPEVPSGLPVQGSSVERAPRF